MRRNELKAKLENLVDRTGRVEDMLDVLAGIYQERARHSEYAELRGQMHATAHVLHEASEAVESIFEDDEARKNPEPKEDIVILRGRRVLVEKQATKVYARVAGEWSDTASRYGKKKDFIVVLDDSEDAGTLRSRVLTDPHPTRKAALAEAERALELLEEVDEADRGNPVGYVDDESFAAVGHFDKVRADLFSDRALLNRKASVRLDIPSSKPVNKGGRDTVVVTVHEPSSAKSVIGYDHTAVVKNALFQVTPAAARDIALGIMNKTPFSYVTGKLVGAGIEGQRAEAVGVPVYYDPRVVHLYVDARNGLPIKAASEVNFRYVKGNDGYYIPEIEGIYIWAVDPVYYEPEEAPGSVLGAKYKTTKAGAWDWAVTEPFALTGTPSMVVMPEARPRRTPRAPRK